MPLPPTSPDAVGPGQPHRARLRRFGSLDHLLPAALFAGVFAYMMVLTRRGLFSTPDSASYLGAAHNLLHGRGLTTPAQAVTTTLHLAPSMQLWGHQPYVEFGPLYPVLIAAISTVGTGLQGSARIVNAGAVAILALSGFLIARRLQKDRYLVPLGAGLFMIFAPTRAQPPSDRLDSVRLGTYVLSDPLAYGLGALSLYAYLRFLQDGSRRALNVSLLLAGLAAASRFQLASLVFAEAVVMLAVRREPLRQRVRSTAEACAYGIAPSLVFESLDRLVFHEQTGEPLRHHGSSHVLTDLLSWLFGGLFGNIPGTVITGATVAICLGLLWYTRRTGRLALFDTTIGLWLAVLAVYVVSQMAFLWFTKTWLNAYLYIDQRVLGSSQQGLYLILVTLVCVTLAALASVTRRSARRDALVAIVGLSIGAVGLAVGLPGRLPSGLTEIEPGSAGPPSELATLRTHPDLLVFSDDPSYIYLATGHAAVLTPIQTFLTLDRSNGEFDQELALMGAALSQCGGEVVMKPVLSTNVATDQALRVASAYGPEVTYPDGITIVTVAPRSPNPSPDCIERAGARAQLARPETHRST